MKVVILCNYISVYIHTLLLTIYIQLDFERLKMFIILNMSIKILQSDPDCGFISSCH